MEFDLDSIYDNLVKEEEEAATPLTGADIIAQQRQAQARGMGGADPIWHALLSRNTYLRERALEDPHVKLHHVLHALKDKNVGVAAAAARHPLLTPEYFGAVLSHKEDHVKQSLLSNPNLSSDALDRLLHLANGKANHIDRLLDHPNLTPDHLLRMQAMGLPGYMEEKIVNHPKYNPDLLNQMVLDVTSAMRNGTPTRMHPEGYASFLSMAGDNPAITDDVARQILTAGPIPNAKGVYDYPGQKHLNHFVKHPALTADDLSQLIAHPNINADIKMTALQHPSANPQHLKELLDGNATEKWSDDLSHYDMQRLLDHGDYAWLWTPENMDSVLANQTPMNGPIRERLANKRRETLTPEQLERLAQDPYPNVRQAIAANPRTPPHVLERLVGDQQAETASYALSNLSATPAVVLKALNSPHTGIVAQATQHAMLPQEVVPQLAVHPNALVRMHIADHPRLAPEQLDTLLADPDEKVRNSAALNPNLTPQQYMKVATNPEQYNTAARQGLLQGRPPPEVAEYLLRNDQAATVRSQAARSQHLSSEAAARFLDDVGNGTLPEPYRYLMKDLLSNNHITLPRQHLMNIVMSNDNDHVRRAAIDNRGLDQNALRELHGMLPDAHNMKPYLTEKLGDLDPDTLHSENVKVRFNTGKLRKVRDLISASGKDEMRPKDLPPGDYSMARLPNGNISASKLQAYIDSQESVPFNVSHTIWRSIQRHNNEEQKVFQLNLTSAHVRKLESLGLYPHFRKLNDTFRSGHPMNKHTLGWVRYSGTPQDGIFLDEVQSDFAVPAADRAVAQMNAHLKEKADEDHKQGRRPKIPEGSPAWEQEVNRARTEAERQWGSSAQHKQMMGAIFGNKHPHEVLHEAFQQYLRDKGHVGTRVAVHSVESKAAHAGRDSDRAEAGHINVAYRDAPKKMGMSPSTYDIDNMNTQSSATLTGKPTWQDHVRKYEKLKGLLKELVLAKANSGA